jgi:hypothetical protein
MLGKGTTLLNEVFLLELETLHFRRQVTVSGEGPTSIFICHAHFGGKLHFTPNR